MTFRTPLERTDPPDGLTEEQAGQRTVDSGTTLHGLVRHMTTLEQWWFIECIAGLKEPYAYYDGEEVDWDWELDRSEGLQADVDRYVAMCERARAVTADIDLDRTITTKRGNTIDIRWIMIGHITEYARHNGHADIMRELIDGTTGE